MLSRQSGVYRVNCIDCLDRTNVVQVSEISTKIHIIFFWKFLRDFDTDNWAKFSYLCELNKIIRNFRKNW